MNMQYVDLDNLAWLLNLTGMLIGISGTAVLAPWVISPRTRHFSYYTTQPARYASAFVALIIPFIMWVVIFRQYSVHEVLMVLGVLRVYPNFGWLLMVSVSVQALMPVLAVLTALRVLCTPPHFVEYQGRFVHID